VTRYMRKRRPIFPEPRRLAVPAKGLLRPPTPFECRMRAFELFHRIPPLGTPEAAHLQRLMDMDVAFQVQWKALQARIPHIIHSRMKNGSGLQLSKLLRFYFLEYADRFLNHGPESFPCSFNVVESFMAFDRKNMMFDLLNEREYLLSINDYFHWYGKDEIPKDPCILRDMMTECAVVKSNGLEGGSPSGLAGNCRNLERKN
jgi:hypothetical protein